MSISTSRPYAPQAYPSSPAPTTASSLNYSAYGSTPFGPSGSRGPSASISSSSYSNPTIRAVPNGNSNGSGESGSRGGGGPSASGGKKAKPEKGESKEVARVHWRALRQFLETWLKDESPTARASAREKLTRLTKLQFQELSTDVYDELIRRMEAESAGPDAAAPFLPVRDDFHPKRNQARQKLATLPRNRFKDLASDVYYELKRRYPEFQDDDAPAQEDRYEEPPAPGPVPIRNPYGTSSQPQPISQTDRTRVNPTPPPMSRLNSAASSHQRQGSRNISSSSMGTHRSRPSRDRTRGDSMEQLDSFDRSSGIGAGLGSMHPTAATSEVVVPNKSRLREEDIEVPYARDSVIEPPSRGPSRAFSRNSQRAGDRDSRLSASTSASMSGFDRSRGAEVGIANVNANANGNAQEMLSPNLTDDNREYYDRMSFSSNVTNKSKLPLNGGWDEDKEKKIRAEYEFRIAGLERRAAMAEQERDEAKRGEAAERDRRREWEEEVRGLKERSTTHSSSLRSLQHELDIARDAAEAARQHGEQRARAAEDEIVQWRDRYEGLEDELRRVEDEKAELEAQVGQGGGAGAGGDADADVGALKAELRSLVEELNALSLRNDELMAEREQDAQGMNDMESRVDEYKRKYDAVRIELRNLKATSTMFVSKPLSDDHLPASPDGNIADVNVSAFQTSVDGLLTAARSSAPSGVLPAMKAIVEAITEIGEDVKTFEAKPNLDVDVNRLESLKYESTTRLSNLMQAARNHAMASGLSPVSLLDAAAGHLSANVVEIIKLLKIKRTVNRRRSSLSIREMVSRDAPRANQDFDREYGGNEERLREQTSSPSSLVGPAQAQMQTQTQTRAPAPVPVRQLSNPINPLSISTSASAPTKPGSRTGTPVDRLTPNSITSGVGGGGGGGGSYFPPSASGPPNNLRVASYQSDAFDLERKASVTSDRAGPRAVVDSDARNGYLMQDDRERNRDRDRVPSGPGPANRPFENDRGVGSGTGQGAAGTGQGTGARPGPGPGQRMSDRSNTSESSPVGPVTADQEDYGYRPPVQQGGDEGEWDELKPYLNTQSSALVNSIQNLLAAIRTGNSSPALNEHLSEVIAIASSIVGVAGNALPSSLRGEGDMLLQDLVHNTNRLSEAQEAAKSNGFEKSVRQGIASASFGVAKALKSLMKLGVE